MITFVHLDGTRQSIAASPGDTVMVQAITHGVEGIVAECGGNMMCATCHVYVDDCCAGVFEPMQEAEAEALTGTASERRPNSRLSCQLVFPDGIDEITVFIPPSQI